MNRLLLLLLTSTITLSKTLAQGEVPVSMYTGTPQITVPLGSVTDRDLSVPVFLSYDATGIRVKQSSGIYGLGWNLVAGGSISREVRGLPDDNVSPAGWMYTSSSQPNSIASNVNANVTPLNNSSGSCPAANELTDQSAINGYFNSLVDTEPDIFNFNFPGYSGQFIFDNSVTPTVHLIPWQDIGVSYTQDPDTKKITKFVIKTHDGVTYTFGKISVESRSTAAVGKDSINVLLRDYNSYSTKRIYTYATEWKLTTIISPIGGSITFGYTSQSYAVTDTVRGSVRNAPPSTTYSIVKYYTDTKLDTVLQVYSITGLSGGSATINTTTDPVTTAITANSISFNDTRKNPALYKTFSFDYNTVNFWSYPRSYLRTITEGSGCDQKPPYKFFYLNGDDDGTPLPPPWFMGVDFWGYANGIYSNPNLIPTLYVYPQLPVQERIRIVPLPSYGGTTYTLPGANRNPSSSGVMAGTLNSIQYPSGGVTNIIYEPNQYYDAQLGQSIMGGGIRIKSFTYFDGINSNATITKMFNYNDSTTLTSGRLISRPMFAVPVQQYIDPVTRHAVTAPAGDWTYQLIGTERDLSSNETTYGSAVGYREVTVSRPGSGNARYQYLVPGTYGDVATGAWAPAQNAFARPSSCPPMLDIITNASPWQFPYSRSADFDYERGLVWQLREYDNNNTLMRKTRTYYQYIYNNGSSPYSVFGLQYERFTNTNVVSPTFLFSKYNLLTDVSKVTYKEQVTTYDALSALKFSTNVTQYDFLSPAHHLLTQVKTTTSDGTLYVKKLKYPLDYGTIPSGADMASTMIANLQANFRNGSPIEQYSYVTKPNDVKKFVGGSVIMYNDFGVINPVDPLPQYAFKLNVQTPLTAFDSSYVDPVSKTFHKNTNYELVQTFQSFDGNGNPLTTIGQDQISMSTTWGYGGTIPVVSARNVSKGQYAFSDFETSTDASFAYSTATSGTGRTGANALNANGVTLTGTISSKGASNYTLSLWLSSSAGTTFTVKILNSAQTATYFNQSITWTPTGGDFQYFERNVPIDPSLTSFVVTIQCSGTGNPLIDDVSFYPVGADLTTSTYAIPFGQNSVTTNGNATKYTMFDGLGRQKYVMDTYKNIREKDAYRYGSDPSIKPVASFNLPASTVLPGSYTFTAASSSCIDGGLTYTWTMNISAPNNSTTIPDAAGQTPSITFPTIPGVITYTATIKLNVSHPVYGASITTRSITVSQQ